MLIDFRTVTSGTTIETDVCVIGAGAAGITLAREFIGSPLDVCLLESGGYEWDDEIQELYRGENVGVPYQPLETGRGRFLGGTTNLWLGACIPLDASALRSREWVPHSGWPIAKPVLDPYYERAEPVCEIGPFDYSEAGWAELGLARLDLDPAKLETRFWQYSPPTRFGEVYRDELAAADNIRAFVYATATNLQADASGSFVDHVDVRSLDGTAAKLRAGAYVIAAGGIENPRLLLNSNGVERAGLGNRHDLVGRFFMEHTYYQSGFLVPSDPAAVKARFSRTKVGGRYILAGLSLSDAVQREEKVLSSCAQLNMSAAPDNAGVMGAKRIRAALRQGNLPDQFGARLLDVLADLDDVAKATYGGAMHGDSHRYEEDGMVLFAQSEQSPNPDSRVRLVPERDELGLQRVSLDWQLTELDKRTVQVVTDRIASEFARLGIGRMRLADWLLRDDDRWRDGLQWGNHHMGTTRMSYDPKSGVVDPDCRVHSVQNLYVAGSSAFPTGGFANPTLTIVALAIRLADHLKALAYS